MTILQCDDRLDIGDKDKRLGNSCAVHEWRLACRIWISVSSIIDKEKYENVDMDLLYQDL